MTRLEELQKELETAKELLETYKQIGEIYSQIFAPSKRQDYPHVPYVPQPHNPYAPNVFYSTSTTTQPNVFTLKTDGTEAKRDEL